MSKKGKIIGIIAMVVAILALTGLGSFFILNQEEEAEGGNVLDVAWYDINGTEFTINSVDEFYEFAKLSNYYNFRDQTVKLGADLVINEGNAEEWGEKAPSRKWTPIEGFGGVFDGQGHTISGVYAKGSGTAIALFSNTMGSAEIKDFELKNSYFEGRGFGGVASISSNGGGTFKRIYSDAIVTVKGSYSGYAAGIGSKINLKAEFEECWFDGVITTTGRNAGGIVDCIQGGVTTISHCLFSGKLESTWSTNGSRIGGLCGDVMTEGSGLELVDSLSTGKVTSAHASYAGSVLGLSSAKTSLKSTDTYGSVDSYKSTIGNGGSNGTIQSSPLEMPGANLVGVKAYQWTNLDFDKYWSAVEEATPVLKYFADSEMSLEGVAKAYDASWYSETASEGVISTVEQLYGFYVLSGNTNFKGKTVKLGSDIVFNEGKASDWLKTAPANTWYQITGFAGTFDGQGHTISGLYMATDGRFVGFFKSTTTDSNVKNFSIKNCLLINHCDGGSTAATTGSVAGAAHGKFENIYSDAILDVTGSYIGGMFGQIYQKTTISNCWFDGKVTNSDGRYTGGVVGSVTASNVVIEHCLNTGTVDVTYASGYVNSGGIVGATLASSGIVLDIKDCLNVGTITSKNGGLGSIIGHVVTGLVNINDCYALKGSNAKDNKGVGHVQGGVKGGVVTLNADKLTGYLAYDWSTLDFANYWSVVLNGTPVLKTWAKSSPSVAGRQKAFDISWYDANATEYTIKNVKQLYGFYIMSGTTNFKGKTVKLGANIAMNSGDARSWMDAAPTNVWVPIESFAGTFDGQGHTISGMYVNTGARYAGFFGTTTKDATVKNLRMTNSLIIATGNELASTGSIAGAAHGTFDTIYSNAIVTGTGAGIGGILGQIWVGTTIRNSWFDGEVSVSGRYSGGVVGASTGGTHVIEHCLNTGKVDVQQPKSGFVNSGGIIGACYNTAVQLTIKDCFNAGEITANYGGVGSIIGHVVKGTLIVEDTYAVAGSNKKDGKAIGNVQGTLNGSVVQLPKTSLLGTGAYKATYLDFNKYWAAIANETPQLKSFSTGALSVAGLTKIYDTSWYDASKSEYTISTMEQLYGLSLISMNTNFAGKTVKLANDITVNTGDASTWETTAPENAWIPITSFAGTLDGQGHTISGIYVPSTDNAGLISKTTKDTVIKNVSIENSLILAGTNGGSIAGQGGGTFYGIYSDAIVKATGNQVGGILGYATKDTAMELVQFDGHVVTARNQVGGFIGLVNGADVTLTNCHVSGKVETTTTSGHMNMGMAIGRVCGTSDVTMEGCLLNGYMTHNHPGATNYDNRLFANKFVGKMEGKNAWLSAINVVSIKDADHWPTYVGLTQGSGAGSIWKQNVNQQLIEEQITGVMAWYNSKLDFYMNMEDTTEGKAWVAVVDEMPVLKIFAEGKNVDNLNEYVQTDTSWINDSEGTADKPYIIKDAGDLAGLSELVNGGNTFKDKFFVITEDIVYNTDAPSTLEGWQNYTAKNTFIPIGQPGNDWAAGKQFAGTLDGQNHTISGIYVVDADAERWAGLFGATNAACTIKNLKLMNSYIEGHQQVGAISGRGGGTFENIESNAIVVSSKTSTYLGNSAGGFIGMTHTDKVVVKNCRFSGIVKADNKAIGGIIGTAGGSTTIIGCMFEGSVTGLAGVGGILGTASGATLVENCHVAGTVTSTENSLTASEEDDPTKKEKMNTGMVVGQVSGSGYLKIYSCLVNGYMNVAQTTRNYANAYVGDMNGTNSKLDIQYSNIVTTGHMHSTCVNLTQGSSSWNGWVRGNTSKAVTDEQLTGPTAVLYTRGLSYCTNADDTSSTWVATKEGAPKLRIFADKEEIADVSAYVYESHGWYTSGDHAGTKEDPYVISKPGELIAMSYAVITGWESFDDKFIALGADIIINKDAPNTEAGWASYSPAITWTQIGNPAYKFKGSFDGQGHSISGVYMNAKTNVGLFGYTDASSTVKNIKLINSYFKGTTNVGSIAGSGGGNYYGVYSNAIVVSTDTLTGGIIGCANADATLDNVEFAGSVKALQQVGGIIGGAGAKKTVVIKNALMSGTVSNTRTDSGFGNVGGLFGIIIAGSADDKTTVTANNCLISGKIAVSSTTTGGYAAHGGQVQANSVYNASKVFYKTGQAKDGFVGAMNGSWGTNSGNGSASPENLIGLKAVENTKLNFYKSATDTTEGKAFVAIDGGMPQLKVFADPSKILTITE